ncbi:MAG: hypothetical protein M3R08_08200, partial [Bacteroidota bacterium]|nr:hypothetical protein [Bacteroidota bacterium]
MPSFKVIDLSEAYSALSRAPMLRLTIPMVIGILLKKLFDLPVIHGSIGMLILTILSIVVVRASIEHHARW